MLIETSEPERRYGRTTVRLNSDLSQWFGLVDLGLGLRLGHGLGLGLILSLRLLLLKLVTIDWPMLLLVGGFGVYSAPTPGKFLSSATVSNIFISNAQQLLQGCRFLGPHMSGYPRIQLFINNFPSNKVNNFFDGGTASGTGSCSFIGSVTHL